MKKTITHLTNSNPKITILVWQNRGGIRIKSDYCGWCWIVRRGLITTIPLIILKKLYNYTIHQLVMIWIFHLPPLTFQNNNIYLTCRPIQNIGKILYTHTRTSDYEYPCHLPKRRKNYITTYIKEHHPSQMSLF